MERLPASNEVYLSQLSEPNRSKARSICILLHHHLGSPELGRAFQNGITIDAFLTRIYGGTSPDSARDAYVGFLALVGLLGGDHIQVSGTAAELGQMKVFMQPEVFQLLAQLNTVEEVTQRARPSAIAEARGRFGERLRQLVARWLSRLLP